jgi:AraC family transcriptional regulator
MLSQFSTDSLDGRPCTPVDVVLLAPALIKLLNDASKAVDGDVGTVGSCLAQALAQLQAVRISVNCCPTPPLRRGGLAPWQEHRVKTYIESHLDRPIKVAELADASRLSTSHLSRALRQSFGLTPQMFVLHQRIERTQMMMISTDQTLSDIALACGFCDQAHFCRRFRRLTGRTPKSWLREHFVRSIAIELPRLYV